MKSGARTSGISVPYASQPRRIKVSSGLLTVHRGTLRSATTVHLHARHHRRIGVGSSKAFGLISSRIGLGLFHNKLKNHEAV